MVEAVLFDLDGTLADTALDLGGALNRLRREHDLEALPIAVLRPHASHGVRGLLGAGLGIRPEDAEYPELARRFLSHYENALCVETVLFEGVAGLLNELDARSVRWGIVTNKSQRYTHPLLAALDLSRRTACVVCGDSSRRPKPAAAPLLMAANLLQTAPEHCAYVGDDLRDITAARAAGMVSVAAAYGYLGSGSPVTEWGADHIVDQPTAIPGLLHPHG